MCLTLRIIILHIIQRGECRLNREIESLIPGIGEGLANGRAEDVGFAVLYFVRIIDFNSKSKIVRRGGVP